MSVDLDDEIARRVAEAVAPLQAKIDALEPGENSAEQAASLAFQAALFPKLAAANDRAAVWESLTAHLQGIG